MELSEDATKESRLWCEKDRKSCWESKCVSSFLPADCRRKSNLNRQTPNLFMDQTRAEWSVLIWSQISSSVNTQTGFRLKLDTKQASHCCSAFTTLVFVFELFQLNVSWFLLTVSWTIKSWTSLVFCGEIKTWMFYWKSHPGVLRLKVSSTSVTFCFDWCSNFSTSATN